MENKENPAHIRGLLTAASSGRLPLATLARANSRDQLAARLRPAGQSALVNRQPLRRRRCLVTNDTRRVRSPPGIMLIMIMLIA